MRISRIRIENFRNFRLLDVTLDDHAVIVGENKVGKSNLLFALRLVLDPSLPDSSRQLRLEDIWDGLRPLKLTDSVRIDIDLADFESDENAVAILAEHVIQPRPMVSRLTYQFRPLPTLAGPPAKESDYEFVVYGGDRPENVVNYEVRSRLPLDVLQALRDAEGDLANWRRSPLKPLLDEAIASIPQADLAKFASGVETATAAVTSHASVTAIAQQVVKRLADMVGEAHAIDATLGLSSTDPERLFRALRLFIEGGRRGVADASLGTANLLYLALKSLELEQLVEQGRRDHSFLAVEEPEAHLHPHLQRLVYRDFLRPRAHQAGANTRRPATTILLTTHSPHVVSIAPLRSLVLLRRKQDGDAESTVAASTANTPFTVEDEADLERYLDVTRGEVLFARAVLLVEGDAETFLVPVLARLNGLDLDRMGVTVCSVAGTNFIPYIKLLGRAGLRIPWAVLTDFDPAEGGPLGPPRLDRILKDHLPPAEYGKVAGDVVRQGKKFGLFLNQHTFEIDLFQAGNHGMLCGAMAALTENNAARQRAAAWKAKPASLDAEQFLKDVNAIGKGRFAQRVAASMTTAPLPPYIQEAFAYVRASLEE